MAENPYMALARKSEAQDEAAENPYLALVKPAARAPIPNAPLGEPERVTELPKITVRPEPEPPSLGRRALSAVASLGTLPATAAGFVHDTLVPGVMGAIERTDFGGAIKRGATSALASGLHTASDFVDQTLQAPQRQVMELLKPTVRNRETGAVDQEATAEVRAALSDPLRARALADESLGVTREIGADRQRAMGELGAMPTLGDALVNPQEAIARKGAGLLTTGVESAPAMALAVASRNPEIGSSLLAGTTGAQEYTDLVGQGVDRGTATQAALLSAMAEKAGEQFGLEKVMAPGRLVSALPAIGSEGAQEFGVQLAQGNIEDQALGRETPVMEQIKQAVDAGLIGVGFGGAAHGMSVGIDALGTREAAPFPNAAPRQPAQPAPEAPQPTAIDPAILAAGNAALGAAPAVPSTPASPAPLGQAEDTSDIDAMLAANIPPEVAAQAQEVAANATPEQQQAAMQALGELLAPTPAAPSEPASSPAQSESPADGAAATSFMQQAAASMRMRSQEQAARTAAPAAQSPAAPVGSRPAGGDLAPAPAAEVAAPKARKRAVKTDSARKPMDLLRVIAANGGLNREAFRAQGVDPAELGRRAGFNYVFRKNGGMGLADLREFMQQEGYLPRDPEDGRPVVDDNDALDVFDRAFRGGEDIFSEDQAEAVAAHRAARKQADDEFEAELAGDPDWHALSDADFDASQKRSIVDLTERAYDLGATDEEIVGAAFDATNDETHRNNLQRIVAQLENRNAPEPEAADRIGEGRIEPGEEAEPAPRFTLAEQPAPTREAPREVAPSQGGGLFGAPTTRDFIDSAQRGRDAARNGRTGTGRTDMLAGDGELFAGARPEQARVPDADRYADMSDAELRFEAKGSGIKSAASMGRQRLLSELRGLDRARQQRKEASDRAVADWRESVADLKGKQPWEMTPAEWGRAQVLSENAVKGARGMDVSGVDSAREAFTGFFGYGPAPGGNRRHEVAVLTALQEGKPVPESVRAAYRGRESEVFRYEPRHERAMRELLAEPGEALEQVERDPLTDAARQFFGTTQDPREAGYILPDGVMLDFSGRHYADNHPSLRGQRSVDHRELIGENARGESLDDLFRLESGSGSDYMMEFMGRTSAMRVDFNAGVASIMGEPTPDQIRALSQGLRGDYAALSLIDHNTGRIIDEVEIDDPTPMKVRRFFDQARGKAAAPNAPLFNEERGQSAPAETPPAGSDLPDISRRMGEADAERLGLRAAVNEALGKVGEKVIFIRDTRGLPEHLRRGVERRLKQREGKGMTAALYDTVPNAQGGHDVYIITSVVRSPSRAVWNALHEIAGHEGLRKLLGDRLNRALEIALQNPTVRALAEAIADERKIDFTTENGRMLAAEEALAELAAAVRTGNFAEIEGRYAVPVPEGIRERLTRAIENFLRRLKAMVDDIFGRHQFTDEDVRALLENAWQAVNAPANGELAPDLDGFDATAPDQTQTPAFRKWFGDSKVVDENGSPLVVYHGTTKSFDRFDHKMRSGMGGKAGFWFASDAGALDTFTRERMVGDAPNVMPVFLSIRKPAEFDGHAGFVAAVNERNGATVEARIKSLRTSLIRRGYDGIVIRGSDTDGGVERDDWVAFEPEQIKSATANRGTFDPSSPSILESVADARDRAEARRNEAAGTLPVARGAAGWNYDAGKWEGRKGQANNARAHLQDKMLAWRDVQGQIEANLQAAIPDAQNVYRLENLMHGRVGEGIDRIEREQVKPLVDAMRAAKVGPATLEEYLYARHAQERNAQIATINPAMPDGGSGMTNADAARILASADRATLDPLARRVDAIAKATRRRLLANGLITQEAFDAMEAQYEHYVPLRGKQVDEAEDFGRGGTAGRGLDSRGKPVRNALGRGAGNRAQNILGEVIGDAERSVILAEKARVGRGVMRIVLANPNPSLWQVEPVQTERALDASGEVYEKVVNDWSDPSVVAVRHKGQLYRVQINSVPLAKALNNVGVDQLGGVTRMAGVVNRYFSAILTKYNPAFTPVNASRDALFGLTGLAAEHGEAAALDAALHYPMAARAAFRQARGAEGDSQWDRWAAEFAAAGGKTGYVNMPSAEEIARKIGSTPLLANLPGGLGKKLNAIGVGTLNTYDPKGVARAAKMVGDVVGVLNDAVENALRLSAYVTLRKRGQSAEAAAAYAKDLTVNFNRKGFDGSKLNAWFLFYNASIQGAHRVSKLARKPKTWGYLGALATAQVIATLAAMGMEDDNGEPLWNKVPDHVKRRNIVIVTPDGGLITIPMPYGFNLFPYIAGRITESVANGERGEKRASDGAAQLTADFIGSGLESFSPVPLDDGVAGLLPTLLRIPVNVWANRNDFGRPIRMEQPYAKSDVPRASMGRPDTLQVFKLMSQGLNRLGGGDDLTPPPLSAFDVAPEDLEYLVKTFTGGPGNLIVDIATVGQKVTGGDYAQDATARDIPITKRFVSNIDEQAAQAAMFYDRRETIDRSLKRVRLAFKSEGAEAAEKLLAATPELTGAVFKRRKKEGRHGEPPGSIILVGGNPQIVVGESRNRGTRGPVRNPGELSVYAAYKAAEEAIGTRNENVETAYAGSPAGLTPNRQRDAFIRTENNIRQAAQSEFNAAWVRDVVGAAE